MAKKNPKYKRIKGIRQPKQFHPKDAKLPVITPELIQQVTETSREYLKQVHAHWMELYGTTDIDSIFEILRPQGISQIKLKLPSSN